MTCLSEPSGGASGQASDIAIHAKEILRVRQLLTSIYQQHCAKGGETEAVGLERFGRIAHSPHTFFLLNWFLPYREGAGARLLHDRFVLLPTVVSISLICAE